MFMVTSLKQYLRVSFLLLFVTLVCVFSKAATAISEVRAASGTLPLSVVVGFPYSGYFACVNTGDVALTNVNCTIAGLPSWATVGTCTPPTPVAMLPVGSIATNNTIRCPVAGTPPAVGEFNVTVTATGDGVSNTSISTIRVYAVPTALSVQLNFPVGAIGQPYNGSYACWTQGSTAPINRTCSVVGLPTWATRTCFPPSPEAVICAVSGTPTAVGSSSINVTTTADNAASASAAGVLTVTALSCDLDFSGSGAIESSVDGTILLRRLLGFRGEALINRLGSNLNFSLRDYDRFVTERQYKVLESSPSAGVSGLVVLRLMQGVADADLLTSITLPAASPLPSAAAIRADVNTKCGTSF